MLSLRAKVTLYLSFVEGAAQKEIAEILGVSQARVSQIIREAVERLICRT